jgi:hypothetical protein
MSELVSQLQFPFAQRQAGLRGRNKPVVKFPLMWAQEYLATPLALNPTFPIDVTSGITDFGLMGNGDEGNCGPCAEVHQEMTTAMAAGTQGPSPHAPAALDRYHAYDGNAPAPGPGVDLASYFLWCYRQGFLKAFAPVDHTNKALMCALMQLGFGLVIGVNLTDNNNDQFNDGQSFDPAGLQIDPNDGHAVVWAKAASMTGPHAVITWGAVEPCTDGWIEACLIHNPTGEAFLLVTTEEQLAKFTPALLADIEALGGTGGATAPKPVKH